MYFLLYCTYLTTFLVTQIQIKNRKYNQQINYDTINKALINDIGLYI